MSSEWQLIYSKQAQKDAKKLASAGLKPKAEQLLAVLASNPYQNPPPYEKLVGDLAGYYSRRINIQHRLVYEVLEEQRIVRVVTKFAATENTLVVTEIELKEYAASPPSSQR